MCYFFAHIIILSNPDNVQKKYLIHLDTILHYTGVKNRLLVLWL